MPPSWCILTTILFTFLSLTTTCNAQGAVFENTAIVRTAELGGSIVHVTTTYAIRSLVTGQSTYTITFPRRERDASSFLEVKIKGQKDPLEIRERPFYANASVHQHNGLGTFA